MKLPAVAYFTTTALTVLVFAGSGVANLLRAEHMASDMVRLGYPAYFMTILGVWKLLGAIIMIAPGTPRLKEWAYAGMVFDLTGAAASRASVHDSIQSVLIPLALTGVVLTSRALRPLHAHRSDQTIRQPQAQSGR